MSESEDIQPTKVIKAVSKQSMSSKTSDSSQIDNKAVEARREYDSRLYTGVPLNSEIEHYRLFRFFDFDGNDDKKNDRIKGIYQWAKQNASSDDMFDIMRTLTDLDRKIGIPDLGVSRVDHFWNFVNIENEIKRLEQERIQRYGK
jgi:hypothetical protein